MNDLIFEIPGITTTYIKDVVISSTTIPVDLCNILCSYVTLRLDSYVKKEDVIKINTFIQRAFNGEHNNKALFFYGEGNTGKTTVINKIRSLFRNNNTRLDTNIMRLCSLYPYRNCKLLYCQEMIHMNIIDAITRRYIISHYDGEFSLNSSLIIEDNYLQPHSNQYEIIYFDNVFQ